MKSLKIVFLVTDIGFLLYWLITTLQIIPPAYLFKDYHNALSVAWNWSFFPLDLCISITGLTSLWLYQCKRSSWRTLALISLVLTFCSGLQALAFWTIRLDFDLLWWIPNGFLFVYPLFFLPRLMKIPRLSLADARAEDVEYSAAGNVSSIGGNHGNY